MSEGVLMSSPNVVVYTGPTISRDEVLSVMPQARVRPPVARGDLLAETWSPDDTAVIIDGYYRERLSVGHKEILWLLDEGVHVIGAASMGALRAAELSPYGMSGAGTVFDMYATGEVDGDDEVAVVHGPAERGYPAGTVALVNIRYGCREGARTGLIPAVAGERIVRAAKALPFMRRTWRELDAAADSGDRGHLGTLERRIGTGEWDVKRLDAMAALRAVGERRGERSADWAADTALTGITHYEALKWRSRREYAPGRWMTDLDVVNAGRLFGDDYPRLHEEALIGLLTDFAAAQGLGLEAYARAGLGVAEPAALPPALASWLTETELAALPVAEQLRLVMVRVWPIWQSEDWRPVVLERVRESVHWHEWADIVARADEAAERTRGRLAVPPPEICAKIFLRHWHRKGTSAEVELARRGFTGMQELGHTVRRFFALYVQNARAAER
ncbi:TfuA-like protein [Microbispora sp. H10830]|uniref:TfuA-like protein n=1 Tax=Microbispora sp. H10830 TaxID=2729109 RepID=UPI001602124A|nr:TfuA-like protein [Microbispora sp. H10830]